MTLEEIADYISTLSFDELKETPFSELCIHRKRDYKYTLQALATYFIFNYIN
jgi:hypothetical protein